jgi:cytochrome c5
VSNTTKVISDRLSSARHTGSLRRLGWTLVIALLTTAVLAAGASSDDGMATDDSEQISVAQAATCVQASNLDHARAGRAASFILWVWARGSNTYLGWLWTTTSLQEGPTGTWNMVTNCDTPPTTSSTSTSSTSSTSTSSTTSSTTTSTTLPGPDGAAIFAANCAVCHGADGSGGAGPDLRGVVDAHGVEAATEVVTNGRGGMPAWGGVLSPEEIAAVVDYVGTLEGEHGHEEH